MYIGFENLPDDAKVWMFYTEKPIKDLQIRLIKPEIETFCNQWLSHELPVESSYQIFFNQVLVVGANTSKTEVGGCSVDGMVHWITKIGKYLNLNFFCRDVILFDNISHQYLNNYSISDFKKMIKSNELNMDHLLLDTTVKHIKDIDYLIKPIHESWVNELYAKAD